MAQNYITQNCCSVQDLQSYLRSWKPSDAVTLNQAVTNLQTSIDYEKDHQNRTTIVKLLVAKKNAFKKLIK